METKPAAAVSIIECDMNVDFEVLGKEKSSSEPLLQSLLFQAPPGYEEPRVQKPQPMEEEEPELDVSQVVFCQSGGSHVFFCCLADAAGRAGLHSLCRIRKQAGREEEKDKQRD